VSTCCPTTQSPYPMVLNHPQNNSPVRSRIRTNDLSCDCPHLYQEGAACRDRYSYSGRDFGASWGKTGGTVSNATLLKCARVKALLNSKYTSAVSSRLANSCWELLAIPKAAFNSCRAYECPGWCICMMMSICVYKVTPSRSAPSSYSYPRSP
jgi:hypothetical protein